MILHTVTRYRNGDVMEYHDVSSRVMFPDLPERAVHRSGGHNEAYLVEMDPELPQYCVAQRDRDGNPRKAFNQFDANGYYVYAIDDRLKKAEQALGLMHKTRDIEWKKVITIILCGLVVLAVVWRFMG